MAANAASANVNSEAANVSLPVQKDATDTISMSQLVAELAKQRAGLKDDVSALIHESLKPLQTAMVSSFQTHGNHRWKEF